MLHREKEGADRKRPKFPTLFKWFIANQQLVYEIDDRLIVLSVKPTHSYVIKVTS